MYFLTKATRLHS